MTSSVSERPVVIVSPQRKLHIKELEKNAFQVFSEALNLFKPEEILLSFNGGKDCTVVLHMLSKYYQSLGMNFKIPLLHIDNADTFPEVYEFMDETAKIYNVERLTIAGNMSQALTHFLNEHKEFKAAFMGNRRTDPYCEKLKIFEPTDPGWPPLTRISPILDWKVREVWDYTFINKLPYCKLYNKGYTSIGLKTHTAPNPYLRIIDPESGSVKYRHAYELSNDDGLERSGRSNDG